MPHSWRSERSAGDVYTLRHQIEHEARDFNVDFVELSADISSLRVAQRRMAICRDF